MIGGHLVVEVAIIVFGTLIAWLGKSALKGMEADTQAAFAMMNGKISGLEIEKRAAFKGIDDLRKDVEMLKSSYWSKEEQREFRREFMEKLGAVDVKIDRLLDRLPGHQ